MIESLSHHEVQPQDLIGSLMTTHTVANPEYDPAEATRQELARQTLAQQLSADEKPSKDISKSEETELEMPKTPQTTSSSLAPTLLQPHSPVPMPGVSTSLSSTD